MALLTIDRVQLVRHLTGATVRVTLAYEDVTARCVSADDEYGWVVLSVVEEQGRGRVELLLGDVSFVWRVEQKRHAWQWVNLRLAPLLAP